MLFTQFSKYLEKLENTPKRLEMTSILVDLIKDLGEEEIDIALYLASGYLKAPFESEKFNIAEKMAIRILVETYNITEETIKEKYKELGDLGDVAFLVAKQHETKLNILEVHKKLIVIAQVEGAGSQDLKIRKTAELLKELDKTSAKYIVRIVLGNARLGFTELTIIDALSLYLGDKGLKKQIEQRYNTYPDIGKIAKVIKQKGFEGLNVINLTPGIPLLLQKAQRVKNFEEVIEKMEEIWLEFKLDGTRVQLHMDRNKEIIKNTHSLFEDTSKDFLVKTFTRNLEDTTNMYPDLVIGAKEQIQADSVILDGEAIGYDPKTGAFLPFQETMQRKRKHGVEEMAKEIPLKYFVFDILYLNGESLLHKPLEERKAILDKIVKKGTTINPLEHKRINGIDELYEGFEDSKDKKLEGLIAKNPKGTYQAGARSFEWIKLKVADSKLLADSIDCVILGYYNGKGARSQFGIGGLLLGVYDEEENTYKTISKLGTGLTEEGLTTIKELCDKEKISTPNNNVIMSKMFTPDVYVNPKIVVEVGADEITVSPSHSAKYALRFPRLLKIRTDKKATQSTTLKELETMYKNIDKGTGQV